MSGSKATRTPSKPPAASVGRSRSARIARTARTTERRERELARTRDDILAAAARAFGRLGFEATTMQAIAQEAGYTAPSLYSYFKSKEQLVDELFERVRKEIRGIYDQPLPGGLSFQHRLALLVHRQLALVDARRDAFAVFLALRPPCPSAAPGAPPAPAGFDVHARRLATWLEEQATADELGGLDAITAAYTLLGLEYAFFRRWLATPESASSRPDLAQHGDLVVNLFFGAIAATPPLAHSIAPPRARSQGAK